MSSDEDANDYFEYEDDGFEDDEMDQEAPVKKDYDVAYNVKTLSQVIDMQKKAIANIQTVLELDASTAAILLRHFGWNSEKLQEQFFNDPSKALTDAGLSPPSSPSAHTSPLLPPTASSSTPPRITRSSKRVATPATTRSRSAVSIQTSFECPVCCIEYPAASLSTKTLALGCGHRFCRDCWVEYVVGKIRTDGESAKIQCMENGCHRIVKGSLIDQLVDPDTSQRYRKLLNEAFVSDTATLRWCPHPGCENVIECSQAPPRMLNQIVPTVTCGCGNELCFGCGFAASHRPVLCKLVKLWQKKCADDSETANWLQANTKECIKCQSTIEKNGGCNHMTCKKCKWEFCWVCMGPWSEHGTAWYQCNRYDEKSGMDARDSQAKSRASLERYLHYFNRWANHELSAKLDADFYKNTEKKMEAMQQSGNLSWIEVQFAKQAVDTVIRARITLKWSYCMAFYLKRNNQTELFEDNQRDLERAVENLGYLLEQNPEPDSISKLRADITNQSAYVQKRHDILMDDTLKGYLERRWEFSVDI
ncbi:hypothetical protein BD324DRAFT_640543 [Kockovaella imperatae]|uniref:RBR-type E3 ubiquitin transferase n=1 Tax=Kockovaella imperatae TaxID=4999 RepID=A0A1Y1USX0_9TREE|nr:hypothetical protein BD324DRAFT_640543 [Kockovaella imperatae]ORX40624.1 hypothetical protein BD324DRAFT_640543 [Kockovaella imperatae]